MNSPNFEAPISVTVDNMFDASLYFDWSQDTVGFGQCSIGMNEDGTVTAYTECMGKEWLRRALYAAVDALVEQAEIK